MTSLDPIPPEYRHLDDRARLKPSVREATGTLEVRGAATNNLRDVDMAGDGSAYHRMAPGLKLGDVTRLNSFPSSLTGVATRTKGPIVTTVARSRRISTT